MGGSEKTTHPRQGREGKVDLLLQNRARPGTPDEPGCPGVIRGGGSGSCTPIRHLPADWLQQIEAACGSEIPVSGGFFPPCDWTIRAGPYRVIAWVH